MPFELTLGGELLAPPNPYPLQSFNLMGIIPEPSVVALGLLGMGALLLTRRPRQR